METQPAALQAGSSVPSFPATSQDTPACAKTGKSLKGSAEPSAQKGRSAFQHQNDETDEQQDHQPVSMSCAMSNA